MHNIYYLLTFIIMDRTKLISVRIDTDALKKIDQFAKERVYWRRNAIINSVLTSLFLNAQPEDILKLLRWWKHSSTKLTISINKYEM